MNLDKLRIMQDIQFNLTACDLSVDIINTGTWFVLQVFTKNERDKLVLLECIDSMSITEAELQLWHDTIVYGPQAVKSKTHCFCGLELNESGSCPDINCIPW